jgi:hypothetical protein
MYIRKQFYSKVFKGSRPKVWQRDRPKSKVFKARFRDREIGAGNKSTQKECTQKDGRAAQMTKRVSAERQPIADANNGIRPFPGRPNSEDMRTLRPLAGCQEGVYEFLIRDCWYSHSHTMDSHEEAFVAEMGQFLEEHTTRGRVTLLPSGIVTGFFVLSYNCTKLPHWFQVQKLMTWWLQCDMERGPTRIDIFTGFDNSYMLTLASIENGQAITTNIDWKIPREDILTGRQFFRENPSFFFSIGNRFDINI